MRIFVMMLVMLSSAAPAYAGLCARATVTKVVDGDTIKVVCAGAPVTVRLIGIDTPETHRPNTPVQCHGPQATAYLEKRLAAKEVRLAYERKKKDRYSRTLAYVYLGDEFINAEMIEQGYAFAYLRFPFTYRNDFMRAENEARAQQRGLWGACKVACGRHACHVE